MIPSNRTDFSNPGHLTWLCRACGFRVTGVDLFPERSFVGGAPGNPLDLCAGENIPVAKADLRAEPLPFPDASFDVVLFNETIEHLEGRPHGVLAEIRRVLRPGGRLFLTTPNVAGIRNRLRLLLGKNIYTDLATLRTVEPHKLHHREYVLGELTALAAGCGLRPVRAAHLHFGKERPADTLFRAATALQPSLRSNLYLEAERPEG